MVSQHPNRAQYEYLSSQHCSQAFTVVKSHYKSCWMEWEGVNQSYCKPANSSKNVFPSFCIMAVLTGGCGGIYRNKDFYTVNP